MTSLRHPNHPDNYPYYMKNDILVFGLDSINEHHLCISAPVKEWDLLYFKQESFFNTIGEIITKWIVYKITSIGEIGMKIGYIPYSYHKHPFLCQPRPFLLINYDYRTSIVVEDSFFSSRHGGALGCTIINHSPYLQKIPCDYLAFRYYLANMQPKDKQNCFRAYIRDEAAVINRMNRYIFHLQQSYDFGREKKACMNNEVLVGMNKNGNDGDSEGKSNDEDSYLQYLHESKETSSATNDNDDSSTSDISE